MGAFIAQRLVKMLIAAERPVKGARVGILGLAFKEDIPDLRNSRVPDIVTELRSFGIDALVHDPIVDAAEAKHEYGLTLVPFERFEQLDALVLAVPHKVFRERDLYARLANGGVVVDVKSALPRAGVPDGTAYWAL
jgi:UDP-N-acetyl-D-galactosamine dehydrogenase